MDRFEEAALIERVKRGDSEAFEPLLLANQKTIYNLALHMLANEEDALDASQETFIKAYSSIDSFRSDSTFGVWLYRMCYNICIDMLRKKTRENKRATVTSLTYIDPEEGETELEISDERYAPQTELDKKELRQIIDDAIEELIPEQREVITMRMYMDMSYEDIAAALDISTGTVKSRISRARQKLAKKLVECGTFPNVNSSINL